MQAPFRHTLLYDGECPICLASVHKLQALDSKRSLEYLPYQDPSVSRRFPHLPPSVLEESIHLVGPEGDLWKGADALEALAKLLPGTAWVKWLFRIPLVRPLARWIYGVVARNRYRWRCGDHCGPGSHPEV